MKKQKVIFINPHDAGLWDFPKEYEVQLNNNVQPGKFFEWEYEYRKPKGQREKWWVVAWKAVIAGVEDFLGRKK